MDVTYDGGNGPNQGQCNTHLHFSSVLGALTPYSFKTKSQHQHNAMSMIPPQPLSIVWLGSLCSACTTMCCLYTMYYLFPRKRATDALALLTTGFAGRMCQMGGLDECAQCM